MAKKPNTPILSEIAGQLDESSTYQSKLRAAVFDGISESDVSDVVKGIVARAKEGDEKSIAHLFDWILGNKQGVKLVQNNYYETEKEELVFHPMDRPTRN